MLKKLNYRLLAPLLIFIVLNIYFIIAYNIQINTTTEVYKNQIVPPEWFEPRYVQSENSTTHEPEVYELLTGSRNRHTFYMPAIAEAGLPGYIFEKDSPHYFKITPNTIEYLTGSYKWYFFDAGFFKGDVSTVFRNRYWGTMGSQKKTLIYYIRFDPTNLTPFYITLILLGLSILISRLLFKNPAS